MNEQAIIDSYNLFVQSGYKKSLQEFKQLLASNPEAVNDSYGLFQQNGYRKSLDEYKTLMGIGTTVESPVAEEPKKKEATVSPFVAGGSGLTKFDPRTGQVVQDSPAFAQPKERDFSGLEVKVQDEKILTKPARQDKPLVAAESTKVVTPKVDKVEEPEKKGGKSYLENIALNLGLGASYANEAVASIPESIVNLLAIPQNYIAEKTGLPIGVTAEGIKKSWGITNPLLDYVKEDQKILSGEVSKFIADRYEDPSIVGNFEKGNYKEGFELLGSAITQSVPVSIGLMIGGAYTSPGKLATVATLGFTEDQREELAAMDPTMSEAEKTLKAAGMAGAESVFSSIGTATIGRVYRDIAKREGAEAAKGILRNGLIETYKKAIEKTGVVAGFVGEGIEEAATQITQNVISGKPAFEGAADAFVTGAGSGVVFTAPISAVNAKRYVDNKVQSYQTKGKVTEILKDKGTDISQVYNVPVSSEITTSQLEISNLPNSRNLLVNNLKKSVSNGQITDADAKQSLFVFDKIQQVSNAVKDLDVSQEDKARVATLLRQRDDLRTKIQNKDDVLVVQEKRQIEDINNQIQEIITKPKEDAIQEQAAGQVPVQPGTGVSQEVAQGEPKAEPQGVAQEGQVQEGKLTQEIKRTLPEQTNLTDKEKQVLNNLSSTENISLDEAEKIFRGYKVNDYSKFNNLLRKGLPITKENLIKEGVKNEELATLLEEDYNNLSRVLSNSTFSPQEQTTLYRVMFDGKNILDEYNEGDIISDKSFASTTIDENWVKDANRPMIKFELEKGDQINGFYAGGVEKEFIINKDTEFVVKKKEVIDGNTVLTVSLPKPQGVTQEGQVQEEVVPTTPIDVEGEVSLLEKLLAQEETAPTKAAGISISSETDVEDLRNRTQSRSQQATTKEEKESANTRVKIIDTAKKAINTLKSVFPDVDIVIHDDEGSYNSAMSEIDGVAGSRGNFFIDTTPDGKTTGRIDINLSKANSRTVAHEIAHGILLKTFGDNKNLFNDFRTRMSKVLKGDVNQQLNDFANQYVDPATGELLDVNHEEFLAELTGILEQQEANVSVTTMQKVAALINEFVSKITGGKFKPFEDTKNTKDVVDFFNTISSAIREGGEIQELNGGGEVGTFNFTSRSSLDVKEAPSVANDSRTFIRDLVEDVDMVDFNGRKFVTNMYDYTTAGTTDLGNGLTINMLGGKNYVPYMMSLQDKKIGDVSNLAAFNTKAQAESFARNAIKGDASLFAPHSGTLSESWQFQQHTFAELVNLILDKKIMSDAELIDLFNKTISSKASKKAFNAFKSKYGKDISNFDSFKNDPKKIVELLDVKNNYSPNLRKALNNAISADKTFQKAIGVKNKEEFFKRIMDPLNDGVQGGEIINVVEFDPKTFQIVQTKPGAIDHHPSFGWTILSKINGIYQPTKFYQSSNVTESYVKYNKSGEQVSRKAEESNFEKKNVSSSAGSIPKVAEFVEPSETEAPATKRISRSQINDALSKASGTTQVATTTGSYVKAANILKNSGVEGDILDYGAGLGLGSDAMSDVLGKTVDSLEVNPERWKGKTPVKYTDANQIDKKYDGIVSLNVVNVVPKSIRDFIIKDIFNNLKDGGTAIISSRGFKGDIDQAKNFVPGPEEKSYIIKRKQDGEIIDVFQKGYDGNELVEYVQDLLGDSAEVVSNNTFGNKGVIIKKSSGVKSRAQLAANDAQRIVNLGRANGLSEQAISTVLQKRGFTQEAIDTALGKVEPAAKKVEVTEEFAPGYDRVLNNMFGEEGVVAKSRKRGVSKEGILENAINYLRGTKVYENATEIQRDAMERNVNKELGKREKDAPSAEKVIGKPKKKQVTIDEMAALKDQIKLEARAAREAKGDLNTKRKALAARIIAARRKGTITAVQARALVNRISKVNLDNPIMVDRLLEYTDKVFDDANYAADMAELRKLQKQAKSRNHTSMTNVVNQFTSINPEDIPIDRIQDYKEALDFLNTRTPFYGNMNEIFDEMLSYKVAEKFDAVKTKDALMDKYKSIIANEVKTVEDYVALIKDLNAFKRKAFQLLQNDAITQEEYDDLINGAGETQAVIEKKFAEQIAKIKKDLIAEIKKQRPRVSRDFSKEENDLIRKYLELSDADLESLSPEDLFILNDLLDNISNGEIDNFRFNEIISKAYTSDGANRLAKQIDDSKFDMTPEEGMKELSEYESSFWEGLLGMGRAKSGALQKFVVSVFNRAIASYENLTRDGYNEFSKLKNKYKMSDKDMHKLGILTTYLQEYMAQFDPKNEGIKDIGKRDWFKEILSSKSMRSKYSSGKPSILKVIGLGKSEIDIIEEIWNSLPKDKDGNVDPKAVYDSYMANDGKFFTKNEKGFFDDVMAYKTSEITPKQKFANEINGASFKEIPFHMMRVRLDGGKTQITPTASSDNGVVRIKAGTGKERVSEAVGPIMTNFEKLFIKNLEQTGRDYFLSGALKDINNTLSGAKKKINPDKMPLLDTISGALSEALGYEFDRTQSNFIFRNLLSARAAITLLRPIRTVAELGSTLLSYPVRAKTLSGYKSLFGEQGAMKKLLEFTNSPMLLRDNINKAIDINDGRIEPQSRFTKATNYLSGLPERTMMITSWMPTFKSEFKNITGIDFDINKFNNSEAYREKYGKAIRESSAAADAQTEKIIGPTTKAGQRREVRIAPKVLANIIGLEGTVSKNTAAGQILGFFSNYPYREVTEFINGFKEAAEVIKDEGALSSLSQLQKPLGIALNVAAYGFLGTLTYAGQLILLGDEDDEERGIKMLKDIMTTEGLLNELASNAISLAGSKYAAGGKALLQLAATIAIESTDDEEQKAKIKKLLKDSVFVDPLPVEQAAKFGGREKALSAIGMYIPQFVILADRYADFIGGINEFEAIYDKVESKGVESLTQDEGTKILALNTIINASQILLNVFGGTSLPEYNNIKTYMNKLKEEAGVADVYKGEEPAKKKSSGGGGGSRGGGMNKTDLKRYNRELYDQLYGEGSATYEIEQEVKAFEKEQREYKKKIKDQVYGGKD